MIQIKLAPGAPLRPQKAMTSASCRNCQVCALIFDRV
jgi:hypothetical protein